MLTNIVRNLKWALLIAIVAGPGFAYWSWDNANKLERVMAQGVEAEAIVDGGTVERRRRSGRSYSLHAIWADEGGAQHAEDLKISSEFAEQVIVDDMLMIDVVHVRYIPGDAELPAVVAEDAAQQIANERQMVWIGAGAGLIGLIGSIGFFMFGRRKSEAASEASPA